MIIELYRRLKEKLIMKNRIMIISKNLTGGGAEQLPLILQAVFQNLQKYCL